MKAQEDSAQIVKMIAYAGRLEPDKTDSLLYYARYIKAASAKINLKFGLASSSRIMGRYYEYKENFDSAIIEFHEYAKQAEQNHSLNQQFNAISDISGVYMLTEQYELAKQSYFECLKLSSKIEIPQRSISQINNNIAGAYQYLKNYDSAFFFYQKAIKIDELAKDSILLAERKSNISEILIPMGKIEMARRYLLESTAYNERNNMTDALWYNYNNLGAVYVALKDYGQAKHYYTLAYEQAKKTTTKTKIVQTLIGFSQMYQHSGDYKKALEYKIQADSINAMVVNENTIKKIAELQEKYQSKKREQQNILLAAKYEKESFQKRNLLIIALSLLLIAAIVAYALYVNNKRKNLLSRQNKLITDQKNRLSELNLEKNSLISVVSHDLNTPIVNIQLWSKILAGKIDPGNAGQVKALGFIQESAAYGYELIQNILNVESVETGHHKIQLEEIDLQHCMNEIQNNFAQASEKKQIQVHVQVQPADSKLLTDKILLKRILENLISNALKFSSPKTNVWMLVKQDAGITTFIVKDEGPGISKADQRLLFGKYAKLGNLPTANEPTTGLGLHIVKRIVEELGGKIVVESSPGYGAEFKVAFGSGS